jgi:integrase
MAKMKKKQSGIRGIKIQDDRYVLDKVYRSIRIYETLDPVTEMSVNDAHAILAERITAIRQNKYFPEKAGSSLTVTEALEHLWEHRLKHKTYAASVRNNLDAVADRLGDKRVADLTRSDMDSYKRERALDKRKNRVKGLISPRTIEKDLQNLSMAINLLVDDGLLMANPIRRFITVKQDSPQKIMLDDGIENGPQWWAIYDAISSRVRTILLTLYETGMRPVEVFSLRWYWLKEVGVDQYLIEIPDREVIDGVEVFREKTGNRHRVPVLPRLLVALKTLGIRNDTDLVFPAPKKGGTREDIESAFTTAIRRAKLTGRHLSPYALRRTRLTIWDAIDSAAAKHASGHVLEGAHHTNYVQFTPQRLLKLVGIDYQLANKSDPRVNFA